MANFSDLLGSLMQGGLAGSGQQRVGNALGDQGLGGLLNSVLGGMGDTLSRAGTEVRQNPVAAGGLGALLGSLLGGGGDSVKGALGGGALAMLAGVAFQAFQKAGQGAATQSLSAGDLPLGLRPAADAREEQALEEKAQLALKAMVSAAKADGQIDQQEMDRILGKARETGADSELQSWLLEELRSPVDLNALVRAIPSHEMAAEVYAASLFAIDVDTDAERDYLDRLAALTGLDAGVVSRIHEALGVR